MISPTVGRVVWFHPAFEVDSGENEVTYAAIVCYVHSDTCVNLSVFDANGNQSGKTSVTLFQGEGVRPADEYCEWMPYQIAQAGLNPPPVPQSVFQAPFASRRQLKVCRVRL